MPQKLHYNILNSFWCPSIELSSAAGKSVETKEVGSDTAEHQIQAGKEKKQAGQKNNQG